jgi:hypothetical protein
VPSTLVTSAILPRKTVNTYRWNPQTTSRFLLLQGLEWICYSEMAPDEATDTTGRDLALSVTPNQRVLMLTLLVVPDGD